jgi:hypothetical protein
MEEVYTKEFVINYSRNEAVGLQILPEPLLFQKRIVIQDLKVGHVGDFTTLFTNSHSHFSFDVFSAAFYMVTRYEEYLPHKRDHFGRFDPEESVAVRHSFLEQPIVAVWADYLKQKLLEKYPKLEFNPPQFQFINTIDVDYAYAYIQKGIIRTTGALLRDFFTGDFEGFSHRLKCVLGLEKDPFDTFTSILNVHREKQLQSIFFVHVGDYDVNDKSIPIGSYRFQSLIKELNDYATVGIHPSFASNENFGQLQTEVNRLARVIHQPVTQSRNHFIKLSFPQTYRKLIELGIQEDYTMGYPSKMGFRAGMCSPFFFYDLDYDTPTSLRVFPFYVMEATMVYYLDESPLNAMKYFRKYIDLCKKHNGTFVSLWHNDSLSETGKWKGWSEIYTQMVDYVLGD